MIIITGGRDNKPKRIMEDGADGASNNQNQNQ